MIIKTLMKGFISILVSVVAFFCIYTWYQDSDKFIFFLWGVIAFILSNYFVAPSIMANRKVMELEKRLSQFFKRPLA